VPTFRWNAPFGAVALEIETSSATVVVDDAVPAHPALPVGMRVDDCLLHSVSIDCKVGDEFFVQLAFEAGVGWIAERASGEGLDAFEFEHSWESIAALGMRDPEWICNRFRLVYLDASTGKAENSMLIARYKALSKTTVQLQAVCAWTSKPETEREADSPLFAVDLAMKF
jgi:hypothetical protein